MKRSLFFLSYFYCLFIFSQTTFDWLSSSPDGNWRQGNPGVRWNPGGLWDEPSFGILRFNNNHELLMNNNVGGVYNLNQLIFGNSNTSQRTINGNALRFFDFSGSDPKIENLSTATHIINVNIEGDGDITDPLEINPINGHLIFGGTINNNGSHLLIYGNNGFSARFNGVISGNGMFRINQNSKAIFNNVHTYTGNTEIDHGELWIETTNNAISNDNIWLGNGTLLNNVSKIFLSRDDGGTNFSRSININPGNVNTRYIGSLNTSGTNTFSGNIIRSSTGAPLNIEVNNAGGTLSVTGVINGTDNITKTGLGTLVLSTNNSTTTGNWLIQNGILQTDNFPARLGVNNSIVFGTASLSGTLRYTTTSASSSNISLIVNGGGGAIYGTSVSNFTFSSAFTLNGNLIVGCQNFGNIIFTGAIGGTRGLQINSTSTGKVVLSGANSYTGATQINSGTLELGTNSVIANNSNIILNGGVFSTGSTTGNSETVGSLQVLENSTIRLGSGIHNLIFAASNSVAWTSGKTLTISGWSGTPGVNGVSGGSRIFIGNSSTALTTAQLSQITFQGYESGAIIKFNGEIIPKDYITYYSKNSGLPEELSNWSTLRNGLGNMPPNFNDTAKFVVQNNHIMKNVANWELLGPFSLLQIENGGIIEADFGISLPTNAIFKIDNGGLYRHNNTTPWESSIFRGTEDLGSSSFIEVTKTHYLLPTNSSYGHLRINLNESVGQDLNFFGLLRTVFGNLIIENTQNSQLIYANQSDNTLNIMGNFEIHSDAIFVIKNTTNSGNQTFNIFGTVDFKGGEFKFNNHSSGGLVYFNFRGSQFLINQHVSFSGFVFDTTGFYFNRNGEQTITVSHSFDSGDIRNRFFYNTTNVRGLNEIYNGNSLQYSISGSSATPLTGFAPWPTSGNMIKNLTINNSNAGLILRHSRTVNSVLNLMNGVIQSSECSNDTSGSILLTMAAESSVLGGNNASYVEGIIRKVGNSAFIFPIGGNGFYAPLSISAPFDVVDHFTACYKKSNPLDHFGIDKESSLFHLSSCEYWILNRTNGSSNVNTSLYFNHLRCSKGAVMPCNITVSKWDFTNQLWVDKGNTNETFQSVTSNLITDFESSNIFAISSGANAKAHNSLPPDQFTKIGFGIHQDMKSNFPNNISGGFLAFDSSSKGLVIPRVSNANRPNGAAGLIIYNTDENCIQLFNNSVWKCIEPSCGPN